MSTKEQLLLENDDYVTDRLLLLDKRRKLLDEERARFPHDEAKQREFDRILKTYDEQQHMLRRLKGQTAKL